MVRVYKSDQSNPSLCFHGNDELSGLNVERALVRHSVALKPKNTADVVRHLDFRRPGPRLDCTGFMARSGTTRNESRSAGGSALRGSGEPSWPLDGMSWNTASKSLGMLLLRGPVKSDVRCFVKV
jgi:hypothetical protein